MKIVLLSYINRSGSTFLAYQLSRIRHICVCPEADILYELLLIKPTRKISKRDLKVLKELLIKDTKFKLWKLSTDSVFKEDIIGLNTFELFIKILQAFKDEHYSECTTIVFKQNYLYRLFRQEIVFPGVKLYGVFLIRDPRAIYNSQKHTINPQTNKEMCNNPLLLITNWNTFINSILYIDRSNKPYAIIQYENMINNLEKTMNELLRHIDIHYQFKNYKQAYTNYINWLNDQHRKIHPDVEKEPKKKSLQKWSEHLDKIEVTLIQNHICSNPYYSKNQLKIDSNLNFLFYYIECFLGITKYRFVNYLRKVYHRFRYLYRFY